MRYIACYLMVPIDPVIPEDPAQLREKYIAHTDELLSIREKFLALKSRNEWLERQVFGRKSERVLPPPPEQTVLPGLIPDAPTAGAVAPEKVSVPLVRHKSKPGPKPLSKDLPRRTVLHDVPPHQRVCAHCQGALELTGAHLHEELEYKPAVFEVVEHVHPQYACPSCAGEPLTASRPSLPVEGARAGAGLLAHVLVQKYADHLPLDRQEKIFARQGVSIAKSTMVGWIAGCVDMLAPVVEAMKKSLLSSSYVLCDETTVPVLDKSKPGKTHTGYLWGYGDGKSAVVFDYQRSRSRAGPEDFLKGFRGYLHSDGYAGYDAIGKREGISHLGCWAHARRKFFDLAEREPWAVEAVERIRALYQVEREAKEQGFAREGIAALRREKSAPLLVELNAWLLERRERLLPASDLRGAFEYTLSQWDRLTRYVEDGQLHIDNNFSERCIRPLVIGRKNWLFAGSHEGAKRSAVIYSLIGTCRLLGVEPLAYLRDVLSRIADHPVKRIAELTPAAYQAAGPAAIPA